MIIHRRALLAVTAVAIVLTACGSNEPPASSSETQATAATSATTAVSTPTVDTTTVDTTTVDTTTATDANGDTASAVEAAEALLATMTDAQRSAAVAERTQANLSNWSNLPDGLFTRSGVRLDTLSLDQQELVMTLLDTVLSDSGLEQVKGITIGDGVLAESGNNGLDFGADHYWIRLIGTPSSSTPWTIQFGGHHLAVNATVSGNETTLAPTLWAAQPASYAVGSATTEPLGGEVAKGFALIGALDATQQAEAILDVAIRDIVLGAGQDGTTLAAEGVKASSFTAAQKDLLVALITEWVSPLNEQSAADKIATATAEIDQTTFAWSGAVEVGNPIYYRVQSPTFVIEFAHQQGQGPNAGGVTHIHAIYREIGNDYGVGIGG